VDSHFGRCLTYSLSTLRRVLVLLRRSGAGAGAGRCRCAGELRLTSWRDMDVIQRKDGIWFVRVSARDVADARNARAISHLYCLAPHRGYRTRTSHLRVLGAFSTIPGSRIHLWRLLFRRIQTFRACWFAVPPYRACFGYLLTAPALCDAALHHRRGGTWNAGHPARSPRFAQRHALRCHARGKAAWTELLREVWATPLFLSDVLHLRT